VEEEFKNERSNILLSQKTAELSDRAKADHDLKKSGQRVGRYGEDERVRSPDGQVPDIGSMTGQAAVAFSMRPGDISALSTAGPTEW